MKKFDKLYCMPFLGALMIFLGVCAGSCRHCDSAVQLPDTVNVATIYGPASYFIYRDTTMGYDYEMMEALARQHGFVVNWVVANSLDEAIAMTDSGRTLIIASEVPVNRHYKKRVIPCGPKNYIEHVLVQPPGDTVVVDVDQLAGRTVYVQQGSKSEEELNRLNSSLDGAINIRPVDPDSLATEDMLAAVAKGDLHLAIVDSETAKLNRTYYPDLNITLAISEPEVAQWAVALNNGCLAKKIDSWMLDIVPRRERAQILKKYFESLKNHPVHGAKFDRQFANGYASPFDHLYKSHTAESYWDWRLLAAQGWTESRFDSTARSWAGASGVMQIMPKTAKDFGLKKWELTNASRSIETAVKILDAYDHIMAQQIKDPIERQKFVMASYNAGPGHVLDAIRLAKKYGLNPNLWDDNVEKAMLMKMNRKYYRDPVVRHGYSRGRETVDYVQRIWSYYGDVIEKIPA